MFFNVLLILAMHGAYVWKHLKGTIQEDSLADGIFRIAQGNWNDQIDTTEIHGHYRSMAEAVNQIRDGLAEAVQKSIRDERMKTELITNVSHDIRTPLTSIISYVDLLKREQIKDEKIASYIDVLDQKSQRLKTLTDDLIEASKLSSGNMVLVKETVDLVELVNQANGEFSEKFAAGNLNMVSTLWEEPVWIEADGRKLWRVLENLYGNVAKYAMEHSRVYIIVEKAEQKAVFVIKNISANPLNMDAKELVERFVRGDVSRSSEGSGLGLSIAQNLVELMKGKFEIYLNGDLFQVMLEFPLAEDRQGINVSKDV
jgi:signal transduction histidine kinase